MDFDIVTFHDKTEDGLKKFTYKIKRGDQRKLINLINKHMKKDNKIYRNYSNHDILYNEFYNDYKNDLYDEDF
tara:strand:- start:385 stop:603 length:219 start_codon:yes stop_codon:yes gene_type:complete